LAWRSCELTPAASLPAPHRSCSALEKIQPRAVSYEEPAAAIRERLAAVHEAAEEWTAAARALAGIDLESGMRVLEPEYKLGKCVKIAMFFLEDDDAVGAETYIKKASSLVAGCKVRPGGEMGERVTAGGDRADADFGPSRGALCLGGCAAAAPPAPPAHAALPPTPPHPPPTPHPPTIAPPPWPQNEELDLQYKTCYARVLDSKRRFLDAAARYYELSQTGTRVIGGRAVQEEELAQALAAAITCTVLAAAGPQRSRMLATLYKDERTASLPVATLLEKVYMERMLAPAEVAAFAAGLQPHQLALLPDGTTVLERSVTEHNLEAASKLYNNIYVEGGWAARSRTHAAAMCRARALLPSPRPSLLSSLWCTPPCHLHPPHTSLCLCVSPLPAELGALLGVPADKAEAAAARMALESRLAAAIDQVEGLVTFTSTAAADPLARWDANIERLCQAANAAVEGAAARGLPV
jgi:hypothetical protein